MSDLEYLDKALLNWKTYPHTAITSIDLHVLITQALVMKRRDKDYHEEFLNSLSEITDPNS